MLAIPVQASGRLALDIERIDGPHLRAQSLHLDVDASSATATLSAERIAVPALAWSDGPLQWRCRLQQNGESSDCSGPLRLAGVDGELSVRTDARRIRLGFSDGATQVELTVPRGAGAIGVATRNLPLAPVSALAAASLPEGIVLVDGTLDSELEWTAETGLEGRIALSRLTLEDRARGWHVAGLDGAGRLALGPGDEWRLHAQARLTQARFSGAGQSVVVSGTPVDLRLDLRRGDDERWNVDRFEWRDPGRIELSGNAVIDADAPAPIRHLSLNVERSRWPAVVDRYGLAAWHAAGLDAIRVSGIASARLTMKDGAATEARLDMDGIGVRDAGGAAIDGLRGELAWSADGTAPATRLQWRSASFDEWTLGRGDVVLQQRDDRWVLAQPARMPMLGGDVRIERLAFDPRGGERAWLEARVAASGLSYDSADGSHGAAGLGFSGAVTLDGAYARPRMRLDARIEGGEVLAGPVYVKFPSEPVEVGLDVELAEQALQVHALRWRDPGVLDLRASAHLGLAPELRLTALQLALDQVELGPALQRYARTALAAKGYDQLEAQGTLTGHLVFDEEGIERFDFAAQAVGLRDGAGRFGVRGLSGGIDWRHRADRPATTLSWDAMEILQIPLGGARADFQSKAGRLTLAEAIGIDVLGGQIRLERLDLQPRSPRGERYSASFAIAAIEMAQLSRVFGWPSFPGNLSGGIPEVVLAGDTIELRGGLDLYVFDGYLGVSGLRLERPFGVAPSLAAEVHFQNFDLEQVTSAFSLGGMSGRLDGTIGGLRLVDWGLVGFDAWLRTKGGGRMSYKAVNDVASLGGGGGLSANLQTMALRLFDTFGYRRFGLRCRLRADVCLMGGIDPVPAQANSASDGYTIVEGSGLPRITIVGHQRRVDWPVLVERIVEATSGQGPIIQ